MLQERKHGSENGLVMPAGIGLPDRMCGCRFPFLIGCIFWQLFSVSLSHANPPPHPSLLTAKIPMRDGVTLVASVYLPGRDATRSQKRIPVILTLTPYLRQTWEPWASYFASHGYAFASVDVRGRGDSEGKFQPYVNEARDGYDAVEWLARQSFCDGQVGMWGGSYGGYNQWAVAKALPPHLKTIVPAAAAHPGVDVPFYNNIGQPYILQWLASVSGDPVWERRSADQAFWRGKFLEAYRQHVPFEKLDTFIGMPSPAFQRFLRHPLRDRYYDRLVPTSQQYRKIQIPILTITGQYDDEAFGALTYYREHLAHATPEAAAGHYLLIGPWDHPGTRTPTAEVSGVKCGAAALLDLKDLHLRWYDWTMKNGPKPRFLRDRFAYYLFAPGNSGASGQWHYARSLDAFDSQATTLYLDAKPGDDHDISHPGTLSRIGPHQGSDRFTYDPMDTRRGQLLDAAANKEGELLDRRYAESIDQDGLIYETPPLAQETDLIGCPSLHLWLSLDAPDADLEAYLYEIQPDGTNIRLWTHTCRLRYRESLREPEPVTPGAIVACDLAPGLPVARRLMRGSRLRLVISCPNTIWAERNDALARLGVSEQISGAHAAHIQIYHDGTRLSSLQLSLWRQTRRK